MFGDDQRTHCFLSAILVSLSGSLKINASWSQVESAVLHRRSEAAAPADLEASRALIGWHKKTWPFITSASAMLYDAFIGCQNCPLTGQEQSLVLQADWSECTPERLTWLLIGYRHQLNCSDKSYFNSRWRESKVT